MRKVALFLLLIFVLMMSSCFAWAGEKQTKQPVKYTYKADKLKDLEAQATDLNKKKDEANKFISDVDKQMLILQGQYSVWLQLPDSFIVKQDSTIKK
jgi:hypothetical protein